MKQFWSLILMILAGCLLIFGSEYSLQGDYHRRIHRLTVSKVFTIKMLPLQQSVAVPSTVSLSP